jgi:hypothetical protein
VPFTVNVMPEAPQAGVVFVDVVELESDVIVGRAIVKATAFDVLALAAGLATITCTVCAALRFTAVTVALNCVGLTYVVGSWTVLLPESSHCTAEQGRKFVPLTVMEIAGVPAVAPVGAIDEIVAAGSVAAETVKGKPLEAMPEFETVIVMVPAAATSAAEIGAVSCVSLTNAVLRGEPFHCTSDPFAKFAPFTVRVSPAPAHEGVELDIVVEADKEFNTGATMAKGTLGVVPPPGPWVTSAT